MTVVDASVLLLALVDDGERGVEARQSLRGRRLLAPELIDIEVLSGLSKMSRRGVVSAQRAEQAFAAFALMPVERTSHRFLLRRCWELRSNLSTYDASYVALAELTGATFFTADGRLGRAPGIRCKVEVVGASQR